MYDLQDYSRPDGAEVNTVFPARFRSPLAFAAAVAGAICLFPLLVTPAWETEDDACLQLIASGRVFADAPDEHLLFSNVLIGLPLKWLYKALPTVPWYFLYQLATLAVAAGAFAYALVYPDPAPRHAVAAVLLVGVAVLPCVVAPQFTKTATVAAAAGLLLFLAPLHGEVSWPRLADVAGGALLVLGSLIRFE